MKESEVIQRDTPERDFDRVVASAALFVNKLGTLHVFRIISDSKRDLYCWSARERIDDQSAREMLASKPPIFQRFHSVRRLLSIQPGER